MALMAFNGKAYAKEVITQKVGEMTQNLRWLLIDQYKVSPLDAAGLADEGLGHGGHVAAPRGQQGGGTPVVHGHAVSPGGHEGEAHATHPGPHGVDGMQERGGGHRQTARTCQ